MPEDATLYVSLKAFIRDGDRVLILNDPRFGLDFPGGKLQSGEVDLTAALRRGVAEETGLSIDVGAPFISWIDEGHPATARTGLSVLLIGYDCRLTGGGELRLSDEHDGHRWISVGDFPGVEDGTTYSAALGRWFELAAQADLSRESCPERATSRTTPWRAGRRGRRSFCPMAAGRQNSCRRRRRCRTG